LTPGRRRRAVGTLQERFGVSERRACRVAGQHRSTQRKQPRPPRDESQRLASRLREIAKEHPRWGWKTAHEILLREGWSINRKRLGEKALQRVAGWPGGSGDLASELLALIDRRLADPAVSEDERGRLERLRQTLGEVGKGVVTGLLTALVKSHIG
jgi:hypothetical protein